MLAYAKDGRLAVDFDPDLPVKIFGSGR